MKFERESELVTYIILNDIKFLGQIHMTDEEYQDLLQVARTRVDRIYMQVSPRTDLYISLALVQIAIRCYQDGRYWPCLRDELGICLSGAKQSYIGRVFLKTLSEYNLFVLPSERDDAEEYVENIKAHAFVTNHYMDGFFDFSYDYYETNLFRQIDEDNVSDDISALSAFMKYSLDSDKNVITSDESDINKASKTYRLLKSTRRVFAWSNIDNLVSMYLPVLKMIDNYYFRDVIPDASAGRLESGFVDWCNKKQYEEENANSRERLRKLHSNRPYIYVNENDESAYIVIPPQKFRYDDCNGRVKVQITYNGKTETYEIGVYKSFGVYLTEEERIPIDDIFGKYDITLKSDITKEYRIKASNYRVFNKYWESREKFRKNTNVLLVKHGVSVVWQNPNDVVDSYEGYRKWQYYLAEINEKSVCTIGGNPVSMSGEFAIYPVYEKLLDRFKIVDSKGKRIIASKTHPSVSFTVEKNKVAGTAIIINGERFSLKSIESKACFDWPEDTSKLAVTLILNEFLPHNDGRYTVYIDVPGISAKVLCDYFLLRNFYCHLDKTRYIYDKKAIMTVSSRKFKVVSRDENCVILATKPTKERFSIILTPQTKDVNLSLITDEEEYRLIVDIDVFKYGFDPEHMKIHNKYIWYSDVGNILYIYMPNSKSVSVSAKNINIKSVNGELIDDYLYRVDITEIANSIRTEVEAEEHKLRVLIERNDYSLQWIDLPVIRRKSKIIPYFVLHKIDEIPVLSLRIWGKADLFIDVYDFETQEKVIERKRIASGDNFLPELERDKLYDIYPYMEENDEFGFDVVKTDLHSIKKTGVVDMNNLEGCRVHISGVVHNEAVLKMQNGDHYFVKFTRKLSENNYQGVLFVRKRYPEPITRGICYVKMVIAVYENTMNMYISRYLQDKDECVNLYYNKYEQRLSLSSAEYIDGYRKKPNIELDADNTTFRIDKDKIRRQ